MSISPLLPLLALIARGDTYGYELKRVIASEFQPHWRIDFAQLYRSLAKLRAQDLVRVEVRAGEDAPDRKLYTIMPRGRAALQEWFRKPAVSEAEFWVKFRLAAALSQEVAPLVRGERERVEHERGRLEYERGATATNHGFDPASLLAGSTDLPLRIAGSDDPLLARLARESNALARVNGSTSGLVTLAENHADVVGSHLRDPDSDEYNISFVRHLVPEQDILLVRLATREYGLLVAPGNPQHVRGVRDLTRRHLRLLNRARGSGARLWLQRHVRAADLDPARVTGWSSAVATYGEIATAIAAGTADVGPALRATAERFGLDFIPLGQEHFDLALPRAVYESRRADSLREVLDSHSYRTFARTLPGYDLKQSGRVVAEIKFGTWRK